MHYVNVLFHQLNALADGAIKLLPSLIIAVAVIMVTWIVARFGKRIADRLTAHTHLRPSLKQLIDTIVTIGIWVLGLLIAATIVLPGLTPGSLVAGLGIGTVAIGFAFQDIFQNFLAGILIMLRQKMRIGDVISCQEIIGKVESISLRETHVRKLSNELTIVPNSVLFKNPVEILTDHELRRHEMIVGVSYDTDLDVAREVIRKAVEGVEGLNRDRQVNVFAKDFGGSSIDFLVRWWAGSAPLDMHNTRDLVIRAVKRALDDAGIEIPFPYVTNTFKEPLTIARGRLQDGRDAADADAGAADPATPTAAG